MFIHSGFGNYIAADKILTISQCESMPVRRIVNGAYDSNTLIDHTMGRRRRSVVSLTTGHVVVTAMEPETLVERARAQRK